MSGYDDDTPRQILDPMTGRPILMAPQRQARPMLTGRKAARSEPTTAADKCPFCPGNEPHTPPEVDAWREPDCAPDTAGWDVRAFANKYPASLHHEVIAEGAKHSEQPADLSVATWQRIVSVWQRRILAMEQRPGVATAYLFKNVGAAAGASIAHNHSQILGLDALPPRVVLELQQAAHQDSCPWCQQIASAAGEQRRIAHTDKHVALVPESPKLPYETWILPHSCDDDFASTDAASLADLLHKTLVAVRDQLGAPALNLWLHRVPPQLASSSAGSLSPGRMHWHFEIQPRTGQLAGLELGGDMYINSVPARDAAKRLRGEFASS